MGYNPKILLFDIETAPLKSYTWGIWQQNIGYSTQVVRDWYVLCWAAKWLDNKKVMTSALPDFKKPYKNNPENDEEIMKILWKLLDEADIVIAHNGNRFDIKRVNSRFLAHGMKPPSPFKSIDTLLVARRHFGFTSNKLNDLGKRLELGVKVETGGFGLWDGCMNGDKKSWKKMVKYNIQDVRLLESVYLTMRPWMSNHPSISIFVDPDKMLCPSCGSDKLQKRGTYTTTTQTYQRYQCQGCGSWPRSRVNINSKSGKTTPLRVTDRK